MNIYLMIDTLNMKLDSSKFNYNHILEIFNAKMDFKAATRFKNGSSTTVNYKNYKFSLSEKTLTATGSLTKLYYGNNIQNLNFNQVRLALMQFETLFEIPFDEAKIQRVDIAANIEMDKPVNLYLDLLTSPSGYKQRFYEAETKSFESSKNSLCFYNKIAEVKQNDREVYSLFEHESILKYEIKLSKNVAKNMNMPDLTMKDLYDQKVYEALINCWHQGYCKIPKLTKMLPSQLDYKTLGSFKNSLLLQGLKSLGGKEITITTLNQMKVSKHVKHSIKKFLHRVRNVEPLSPVLQRELDEKINTIYVNELRFPK